MFIAQFVYIILLKWMDPPITLTQFFSWITGHGLKRDYVDRDNISYNAKLAVIASLNFACLLSVKPAVVRATPAVINRRSLGSR